MDQKRKKVFIIGMMGVGKTTMAKRLAKKLDWQFFDTDLMIESNVGMSVPEIFSNKGEAFFRNQESELLGELGTINHAVVSVGGGFPCHSNAIEQLLASGLCVYLSGTPAFIASRIKDIKTRPLLADAKSHEDVVERIGKLLAERSMFYSKAQLEISAIDASVDQLIAKIKATLE